MDIGIIGAGNIGATLARKLSAAGHTVRLANSRGPETIRKLTEELGASAVTVVDAVKSVDGVIVSVPQKSIPLLPRHLFSGVSDDVIVVDTGNYYP
jgi:8-hydroxy-5-deazaflavin:NADPH oxidoreductase